jgi:formate dehydrogenase major subunit
VRKAQAAGSSVSGPEVTIKKNICTHCSVGCTVTAEVVNGVWVGQEPSWESPINRGTHCAKGAAIRETVHGERRLKYPLKLVNGQWQKVGWDQAIDEIGRKLLDIRRDHGADSVYWLGCAKYTNEAAYLLRKFAAFFGTNSVDHQARICHSTTVAGVANTWGYGAQTNSYNDIRNARTMIIMGGNPAEAHPISMQHVLAGKEINRANMIVIDPRFTRTAAHATEYVRLRSGTDIPLVWGILWHIFQNAWEDKEFIRQRVYGMDDVRNEVAKWTPDEVERVTGVPGEQLKRVAYLFANEKPATLIWCMGATQHTVGTANVRALCILCLATGNIGKSGTGANIFRGHTNVQGATDLGLDVTTLPLYYGLVEGAWRHWARVWDVSYDWLQSRFDEVPAKAGRPARTKKQNMEAPGITSTRWFDGVNLPEDQIDQRAGLKAMMVFGHNGNTVTRIPEAVAGMNKLELLVVGDPFPTSFAALGDRRDNTYLLPVCTTLEMNGSRTASNRSLQWGEQIVKPAFESKNDYEVLWLLAKKLGFVDEMFKHIKVEDDIPVAEDILREINRGGWSTGYCGQSPERLKAHMKNQHKVRPRHAAGAEGRSGGRRRLLRPALAVLGQARDPASGYSHTLQHRSARERRRRRLPGALRGGAERPDFACRGFLSGRFGSHRWISRVHVRDPEEARLGHGSQAGRTGDHPAIGGNNVDAVSWAIDLSGGIQRVCLEHGVMHYGNGKARANAWNLPDPVPVHREPIYSPRPDLVAKYPTRPDERQFRLPNIGFSVQEAGVRRNVSRNFPIVLSSGRIVEFEGGGEETRSNPWLAELQQDMFVEINPGDAAERGIKDGGWVWVLSPENNAKDQGKGARHRAGRQGRRLDAVQLLRVVPGEDMRSKYPAGTDPIVLGESVNTLMTYGYDPVTGMQETKTTLCQIQAA